MEPIQPRPPENLPTPPIHKEVKPLDYPPPEVGEIEASKWFVWSRTILSAVAGLATTVVAITNPEMKEVVVEITEAVDASLQDILVIAAAAGAIIFRFKATKKVTLAPDSALKPEGRDET
jgi:hypothetical protein